MADKDYYKILDLSRAASNEDVKKAYRALAMQYHPDRNRGNQEWAHQRFIEINEAFSVLGDPQKRLKYDNFGLEGNICDISGDQASRYPPRGFSDQAGEDGFGIDLLDDIFAESLSGTGYAFRAFRRRFDGLGKAGSGQASVDIADLSEEAQGFSVPRASYEIVLTKTQAGKGIEKELVRNGKRLKVKIPAGVKSGSRIRLTNALLAADEQPGDILIIIEVKGV